MRLVPSSQTEMPDSIATFGIAPVFIGLALTVCALVNLNEIRCSFF